MPTIFKGCERSEASTVETSNCAAEMPVVVLPSAAPLPDSAENSAPSKMVAIAVALLVRLASEQIIKRCIGLSYTNPIMSKFVSAPDPGQKFEKTFLPVAEDTYSQPANTPTNFKVSPDAEPETAISPPLVAMTGEPW